MRIEIKTAAYNERRYGKPWIAVVEFGKNPRGDYRWGDWISDGPGSAGLLILSADPGQIVASGQRDLRGGSSSGDWGITDSTGAIYWITGGKPQACQLSTLPVAERLAQIALMAKADAIRAARRAALEAEAKALLSKDSPSHSRVVDRAIRDNTDAAASIKALRAYHQLHDWEIANA